MYKRSRPRYRSPPCSDEKYPESCQARPECSYDYSEKVCRDKRSPGEDELRFSRPNLPVPLVSQESIYDFLEQGGDLLLASRYPHDPQFILTNFSAARDTAIVRLLNLLPDDPDWFSDQIYDRLIQHYPNTRRLGLLLGLSGNYGMIMRFLSSSMSMGNEFDEVEGAAEGGHINIVNYLMNKYEDTASSALLGASRSGDVNIVDYYFDAVGDAIYNLDYITAAAERGHLQVVEYFVEQGVDENLDEVLRSAAVAMDDNTEVLQYLISVGNMDGASIGYALEGSARAGNLGNTKFLVEAGADEFLYLEALAWAVTNNHIDVSRYLLSVIPQLDNEDRYLLLESAVGSENVETVRFIVETLNIDRQLIIALLENYDLDHEEQIVVFL